MKSILIREHGEPDVLKYEDIPDPIANDNDVIIKVKAIGMNHNDVWARKGLPGMKFHLPHIPGTDIAGEIVEVGSSVQNHKVGDRVTVHPIISCRKCFACTSGNEYFCKTVKVYGFQTGPMEGGYAEYAKIPQENAIPIPDHISYDEAAALTACLGASWHMLVTKAKIQPGETILVWGATSGIGITAIQIAKLFNARVIAVAGTEEKLEAARLLGADKLINYNKQNVFREVRKYTEKRGVDVVFEHTGVETWDTSIKCMAYGARLVTCGNTTGFDSKLDLRVLFWKQLSLLGCHAMTKPEVMEGWKMVAEGKIKPVLDRQYHLKDAVEAHYQFESGDKVGKIILSP